MGEEKYSYTSEIQKIMRGYGDYGNPLQKSAEFIEDILRQQMNSLLIQASENARIRESEEIGHQDILFLMRKNKMKLRRLLKYMKHIDSVKSSYNTDDTENSDNLTCTVKDNTETPGPTWHVGEKMETSLSESENKKKSLSALEDPMQFHQDTEMEPEVQLKTRISQCLEFLEYIDETGDLYNLMDSTDISDEDEFEIQVMQNQLALSVDREQYLRNEEERQLSFATDVFTTSSFKKWLYQDNITDLKLNPLAFEMVGYLAHTTITTVITLALHIKRSRETDPLEQLKPLSMCNAEYLAPQTFDNVHTATAKCHYSCNSQQEMCDCSSGPALIFSTYPFPEATGIPPPTPDALPKAKQSIKRPNPHSIQPNDIVEVLNRFYNRNPCFTFQETSSRNKKAKQLFCC